MKAITTKGDSKKRKRDESQETISENTKKTRVHAQRKFAQGATYNSPVMTPVKDKVRPPAAMSTSGPLLTGKCPNTEDFLTFLCFRRTSILPAKLDFFKDGPGSEPEPEILPDKFNLSGCQKSSSEKTGKQNSKKYEKKEESKKSQAPAVQELRKKYQEQRLARHKPSNVTTLARKVKGKNMVRTRSSAATEETDVAAYRNYPRKQTKQTRLRSGLKVIQINVNINKKPAKRKHLRSGLRSGGSVTETALKSPQEIKSTQVTPKKPTKESKVTKTGGSVPKVEVRDHRGKKTEMFSDFSSDDNEPLLAVKRPKVPENANEKKSPKKGDAKTKSQISDAHSGKTLLRPTRKTKEAAALYVEMISKKLVSTEKSGDEDGSSDDSFPELPNVKRTEQRETEIKAKAFAPAKSESKKQDEEKPKENKKLVAKKNHQPAKTSVPQKKGKEKKPEKTIPGKDNKNNEETCKDTRKSLGTEEHRKAKEIIEKTVQVNRPSTRSRPIESFQEWSKPEEKLAKNSKPKINQGKNTCDKTSDKSSNQKDLRIKSKKKTEPEDTKNIAQRSRENFLKASGAGNQEVKQEQLKVTRKTSERKSFEKNEVLKADSVKQKPEIMGTRKRTMNEASAVVPDVKKSKSKKKKPVGKDKDDEGKEEQEEDTEDVSLNKRPTRKCSTADKIWIDIDGFTSDEDDFLQAPTVAKTRTSARKGTRTNQNVEHPEILSKLETTFAEKSKKGKTKESKTENRKSEMKKVKADNKQAELAKTSSATEKKVDAKLTKNSEGRNEVDISENKVHAETKSAKNDATVEKKTSNVLGKAPPPTEKESSSKTNASEPLMSTESKKGFKNKPKHFRRLVREAKKGEEKEEKGENEEKEEKRSECKKRTRPIRQCSTGEKRWIETDSDSFSFYETSDEELLIDDVNKVKSSPHTKETKEEWKKEKNTPAEEKKQEDNFSESDEEPLKKKTRVEESVKNSELELKEFEKNDENIHAPVPSKKPEESTTSFDFSDIRQIQESVGVFFGPDVSRPLPLLQPIPGRDDFPTPASKPSAASVPNRIEMILHSLKRDRTPENPSSHLNNVSFESVQYGPVTHSSQMNRVPCTYQVKATFPSQREPISTHGLDLLSEVALPTTPKENVGSQTKRIEKWLSDSSAVDQKSRFPSYDHLKYKTGDGAPCSVMQKSQSDVGYYLNNSAKVGVSSHEDFKKFGQMELLESQKILKKNVFAADAKQDTSKLEQQQQHQQNMTSAQKKLVTSVQDLLKLQKERKEVTKTLENAPHLKNCKCNNCIVKKGWFKNKPVPKMDQPKSPSVEEESPKPFESLTKAFIGDGKNNKMSVSVAPMMVPLSPTASSNLEDREKKGGLQQKKLSFLERMKERERKEAAAAAKQCSKAFSPSDESSVYAFEPEPEQNPGLNAPFRSKTRESRTSSASRSDDEGLKICEDDVTQASPACHGKPVANKSNKSSQSASIAVQVNLDSETGAEIEPAAEVQDGKSIEISTQTEVAEEDPDSPMFYIPLQQSKTSGASPSSDQQLIQGVALKLGTEGPMGPNQRVIMKAKLVTKPPDSPSIKAVVMPQPKRIFDQKFNNPPIGTVQPTTRKPPDQSVGSEDSKNAKPESPTKGDTGTQQDKEVTGATKDSPSAKPSKGKESTQKQNATKQEINDELSPAGSVSLSSSSPPPPPPSSKSKRPNKQKNAESAISPTNSTAFPPAGAPSKLVEAPTFHPTEKEFQDPFEFFERIRSAAEKFGLCRIVPPSNFKPDCKVSDDMRFTAYNQYVHRMFHRWGPNVKEMMAIKKYLATQSISLKQPPWIGGIEVDLPRLYQSVQNCGGLMKVMEKKKWHQVADMMKIPKAAQDRVTKLDDIYCKYLLPYDTLSHDERQKLFDEVEKDWEEKQKAPVESQDSQEEEDAEENYVEECEECVVKGRNMALNQFYRIARNTMSMWFKNSEPPPKEVESEFWKHVSDRNHHVCVHSGSIDSSGWGYGFPIAKNNSFSKHPWNLKVLTNNSGSVLRYLGPVMGVTVPTLHVGMVFTAFCWYRDPHGLPWIEYLHTGAPKIWYGISDDNSAVFQEALTKLLPRYIKNKTIWLPSDTAMIPPALLVEHGVSLCQTVQEPGQFIVVFPRAFTSSICTGYLVSESVYFAQMSWLATAEQAFKDIQESCEPSMFSLEKLLFSIASDSRSGVELLKQILPMVWHVRQKEIDGRKTLFNLGLKSSERLPARESGSRKKKGRWVQEEDGDYECEICRTNLYMSLVTNSQEEGIYCLSHAVDLLTRKRHQLKYCKLMYTYTQEEMNELVEKLELKIETKSQKKLPSKAATGGK